MNKIERIKMVKAMEFIVRNINDEEIVYGSWFSAGVADGDISYGELEVNFNDAENLSYYIEDENFADLMNLFLRCVAKAKKSGGLYCDGIVTERRAWT